MIFTLILGRPTVVYTVIIHRSEVLPIKRLAGAGAEQDFDSYLISQSHRSLSAVLFVVLSIADAEACLRGELDARDKDDDRKIHRGFQ